MHKATCYSLGLGEDKRNVYKGIHGSKGLVDSKGSLHKGTSYSRGLGDSKESLLPMISHL